LSKIALGFTLEDPSHKEEAINKRPVQARVFALTPDNAKTKDVDAEVITGIIPLFSSLAYMLFDSGVTHSFVSATYAKLCSMSMEPLRKNI
jgi:hypothetical protein